MIKKINEPKTDMFQDNRQKGQSMVIIALSLVGLLAFVGIAVDVGFIFQRSSKLQSAVDSAALAGVVEIEEGLAAADQKAGQFLNANDIPLIATQSLRSTAGNTLIGEQEYTLTVTWPVELYFLKLIGLEDYVLTRSATAAYFPQADIYASRRVDQGLVNTSNQSVFGPWICTAWGDPFSPNNSRFPEAWEERPYSYKYRILIPSDYPDDVLRVELFDPDSYNVAGTGATVIHSKVAQNAGFSSAPVAMQCASSASDQKAVCNIRTGEENLVGSNGITYDHINAFWTVRIDENRGKNNKAGVCENYSYYSKETNTRTLYSMFYYRQNEDGTIEEVPLARYTGQVNDGKYDNGEHDTDLRWVSPGGGLSIIDQTANVPVDSNTPINPATNSPYTFELNIERDLPNILTEIGSGNRYVYLDVQPLTGGSENGYEIWAGPDDYINTTPSNVNSRNLYILNNPGAHYSKGATVFAMGNLPMNSNISNRVNIPLMYVGSEMAGGTIYVDIFDPDAGAKPPVIFFFDSLAFTTDETKTDGVNWAKTDWAVSYGGTWDTSFGCFRGGKDYNDACNDQWVRYKIQVPGGDDCFVHPTRGKQCIPFYGGRFSVNYKGGQGDTYGWEIRVSGDPYLKE